MKLYGVFRIMGTPKRRPNPYGGVPRTVIDMEKCETHLVTHAGHPLVSTTRDGAEKLLRFYERNRVRQAGWAEKELLVEEFATITTQDVRPEPPQEIVAEP